MSLHIIYNYVYTIIYILYYNYVYNTLGANNSLIQQLYVESQCQRLVCSDCSPQRSKKSNDVRLVLNDPYKCGLSSVRQNVTHTHKHFAGPTPDKVQFLTSQGSIPCHSELVVMHRRVRTYNQGGANDPPWVFIYYKCPPPGEAREGAKYAPPWLS